ncbi:MAG: GNAT family N-acetyltransferase [Thermoleophilia bacterium]|nr:GNAT family N-acetyltransferase [Thermoleophilia bacterium]
MSFPPPVIREATVADAAAIARVHVASWAVAYRGLVPRAVQASTTVGVRTVQWRPILSGDAAYPGSTNLVALVDGEIAGFACHGPSRADLWPPPSAGGELYALYAQPSAWGRGVGRALMDASVTGLRDAGHADALLWVLRGNERARRFYERMGWVTDGGLREQESERLPVPAVRYARGL